MKIAIIGGGAAGFFSAIEAKKNFPEAEVNIFEKSKKLLSKVKISGGGRCNVTNACPSIKELAKAYPRGEKVLKKAFHIFNNKDTISWFESRNVPLVTQEDDCVFPASQNSQSIIDALIEDARKNKISIFTEKGIESLESKNNKLILHFFDQNFQPETFDKVIVTTGGSPKRKGLNWLEQLGHKIIDPVPSLFTFNMPKESITKLMGVVVENAIAGIQGTKLKASGPLLITHWGMSGPAILKLSSFGARILNENKYSFNVQINWANSINNEIVYNYLDKITKEHPKKLLSNIKPYRLPERLWLFLINKIALPENKKWGELGKKGLNKLVNILTNDIYSAKGKTTFREEFVTCGGVSLESINTKTMESKVCKNLYFAGEIMDIDGITGGYNLQNAWTTGFIAGKLM